VRAIAASIGPDAASNELRVRAMLSALRHRGADGERLHASPGVCVGLATTRSAPEESVADPFVRSGTGWLLGVDGRLEGHLAPGGALESMTSLDDRTALDWIRADALGFVAGAVGEYALFAWDPVERLALLSRDRVGTRSLYYARLGDSWLVASELQALLVAGVPFRPDRCALSAALVGEHHEFERTLAEGVRAVPCGGLATLRGDEARLERRAGYELVRVDPRPDPCAGELRRRLRAAVASSMRAEGPVAILMSGGLDSTSIAAMAAQIARDEGLAPPLLVTNRYPGLPCDEGPHSRAVAEHLGLPLHEHEVSLDPTDYPAHLTRPEYGGDPWVVTFRGLQRALLPARPRVFLTGVGGDEVQTWASSSVVEAWHEGLGSALAVSAFGSRCDLASLRSLLRGGLEAVVPGAHRWRRPAYDAFPPWLSAAAREQVELARRERNGALAHLGGVPAGRRAWLRALSHGPHVPRITSTLAQMVGAEGAELRFPLFDRRVVDYFLARPVGDRVSLLSSKPLLRAAMRGLLPDEVRLRVGGAEFSSFYAPLRRAACATGSVHELEELGLLSGAPCELSTWGHGAQALRLASMAYGASAVLQHLSSCAASPRPAASR